MPEASSTERIIYVVVVLPLVPVMPMVISSFAGFPKYSAESPASAIRLSFTCITVTVPGTSTGFSATITDTPLSATSLAKLCPSATAPLIHTNKSPSDAFLESYAIPETSIPSMLPCMHVYSRFLSKSSSFIDSPLSFFNPNQYLSHLQIQFLQVLSSIQCYSPCHIL